MTEFPEHVECFKFVGNLLYNIAGLQVSIERYTNSSLRLVLEIRGCRFISDVYDINRRNDLLSMQQQTVNVLVITRCSNLHIRLYNNDGLSNLLLHLILIFEIKTP